MNFDKMYISDGVTFGDYKKSPKYRINSLSSTIFYICIGKCGDTEINNKTMNQRIAYAATVIKVKNPELEDAVWAKVTENISAIPRTFATQNMAAQLPTAPAQVPVGPLLPPALAASCECWPPTARAWPVWRRRQPGMLPRRH